jgi:hypothetical protein
VRNFHTNLEQFGMDRGIRYAMVVGEPHARGVLAFGIALAKDAGWDIEIFEDRPTAEAWLARP